MVPSSAIRMACSHRSAHRGRQNPAEKADAIHLSGGKNNSRKFVNRETAREDKPFAAFEVDFVVVWPL